MALIDRYVDGALADLKETRGLGDAEPRLRELLRERAEAFLRDRGFTLHQIYSDSTQAKARRLIARYDEAREVIDRALSLSDSDPVYVRTAMATFGLGEEVDSDGFDDDAGAFFDEDDLPELLGLFVRPRVAGAILRTALDRRAGLVPEALAVAMIADVLDPADDSGLIVLAIPVDAAARFVEQHHSELPDLNKRGLLFAFGAFHDGNLVAVATANTPTGRWAKARGSCTSFGVLELTRVASAPVIITNRRGRRVPLSAGSKLVARVLDLLPQSGRRGRDGCLFVTYSLTREEGTTYLALADKGLRPTRLIKPRGGGGARSSSTASLKAEEKIAWEAGPAARAPEWSVLLRDGESLDPPPRRLAGAIRAFARFAVRQPGLTRSKERDERMVTSAVRESLTPELRYGTAKAEKDDGCLGYCYVASEAVWHLLGGRSSGLVSEQVRHEGVSHWYLRRHDGSVLDLTACQFTAPVPYGAGRPRGFLTSHPSSRAKVVIERSIVLLSRPSRGPLTQRTDLPDVLVVRSPSEGVAAVEFPPVVEQSTRALDVEPLHRCAVLLPCASTKPFSASPSHEHGYLPALSGLPVDLWVVSEPLGVIPYDWIHDWPNAHYDFPPEYLVGEARSLLVARIRQWLATVGKKYDVLLLALPQHHMTLVRDASQDVEVNIRQAGVSACRTADVCSDRDFRATSRRYRKYLRRETERALVGVA